MAAAFNQTRGSTSTSTSTSTIPGADAALGLGDNWGLSQMHKWFLVTGALVALSLVLGVIYFAITHRHCTGNARSGNFRRDPDVERCRRKVLPEAEEPEGGQGQGSGKRMSTHLFVNKWMSRNRPGGEHDK